MTHAGSRSLPGSPAALRTPSSNRASRRSSTSGHRGASGAEPDSGDGAGILLQLPDAFLRETRPGLSLPAPGSYGVGMAMLPQDPDEREQCEAITLQACSAEGLRVLGWRDVPVAADAVGRSARSALPVLRQLFVAAIGLDGAALEGRLLVLRRVIERDALAAGDRPRSIPLGQLLEPHRRLQGNAHGGAARGLLPGPASTSGDLDAGPRARALLHQRPARVGTSRSRSGCRRTTARSTRCAATSTGCARASRSSAARTSATTSQSSCRCSTRSGSDSSQFDNALELLAMTGRSIEHAVMMMIPEAWHQNPLMDDERRAFYEFHSSLLEPWDGPAAIAFTDGRVIGATLDRNGLRPARYLVTEDGLVVMASEAGVLDLPEERIATKWRLEPGTAPARRHRGGPDPRRRCRQEHAQLGAAVQRVDPRRHRAPRRARCPGPRAGAGPGHAPGASAGVRIQHRGRRDAAASRWARPVRKRSDRWATTRRSRC